MGMKALLCTCAILIGIAVFVDSQDIQNGDMGIVMVPDALKAPSPGYMRIYRQALDDYEAGRFDDAARGLAALLATYPHYDPAVRLQQLVRAQLATNPDEKLRTKLQDLVLPRVQFANVPLGTAIDQLRLQLRTADPQNVGVNIVLEVPAAVKQGPLTINLVNVTAADAFKYICDVDGLTYQVKDDVVLIAPQASS